MPDEPNPGAYADESGDREPQSVPSVFTPPPQAPFQPQEPPRENNGSKRKREPAKLTDHIMAWATVIMAIATISIGVLAFLQWRDSAKLTNAATLAATAADKFKDSAAHLEGIINTAQGNMQTMADSSTNSIKATQDSMRLDQRAWVGIGTFEVAQFDDKKVRINIENVNSGKTPALSRSDGFNIRWDPQVRKGPAREMMDKLTFSAAEAMPPQGHHTMHIELNWKDPGLYQLVKDKSTFISVFGEIRYEDVFGHVVHRTDFCIWLVDPETKELGFCETGNNMN